MRIEPSYMSIGRLFHQQYIFRVPKYQRSFAWGESEIDDFLADLEKCHNARCNASSRHHLFGGIVSVEGTVPGSSRRHCELIDGQQRLATFTILVSSIISSYQELAEEAISSGDITNQTLSEARAKRLKEKYLVYEDEINRQTSIIDRLELSGRDKKFFKEMINGFSPTESRNSHKRLKDAFKTIADWLVDLLEAFPSIQTKMDALEIFERILDEDCTVIHIVTDSQMEAYRLFQVLNDRGVGLTEGDLLRARTLELLSSHSSQQGAAEADWDEILMDPPEFTENFLMWFYASVEGKRPTKANLFDNFLDAFFPQHKNTSISLQDANAIVSTTRVIKEEIANCRKLAQGEWPYPHAQPINQWQRDRLNLLINALDHKNCMPLLLAACKLDHTKFSEMVQILERFVFRYKNICNLHIGPVTRVYYDQSRIIRVNPGIYSVSSLRSGLSLQISKAPDSLFRLQLNWLVYNKTGGNKILKYFLLAVEYYFRWYEQGGGGTPQCADDSRVYNYADTTIEHIYPQNPDPIFRDTTLDSLVNSLGNLTILGPTDNDIVGNSDFNTKKTTFVNSSVSMNREIANEVSWNRTSIEVRQQKLLDMALKIFQI